MSKTILVMPPNWVGDAVMATPALRALREAFPKGRMIAAGRETIRATLDGNPWIDEFIVLNRRFVDEARAAWRLRRERIDVAVLFPNSLRSALFAKLAGARQIVGFARYGREFLLTDRLFPKRDINGRPRPWPVMLDYLWLAKNAAVERSRVRKNAGTWPIADPRSCERGYEWPANASRIRMKLATTSRDEHAADAVWQRFNLHLAPKVICLNPGAAFGASKLWPADHFAGLARRFAADGAGVLILCGPAERELAERIAHRANHLHVHSLAREAVSIGLTKACVRRCDLLVTTDSGPRHFAAAFDRPVVTLFGPTHQEWTHTWHPRETRLQLQVPCGPCQQRTCATDHRCMRDLHPDDVYRAAAALLEREACHAA